MRLNFPFFLPTFRALRLGHTRLIGRSLKLACWGVAALLPVCVAAQLSQTTSAVVDSAILATNLNGYVVTERGPNHRVWQRITTVTNELGEVSYETNGGYTELATGMHHLVGGQWVESSDAIQITAVGGVATNCQHQVAFAANINTTGAIDLTMPDGNHLRSHILGLSYLDPTTGQYVLIASLKDSTGQIVGAGSNEVIYADAFDGGFKADVLYHNTKAGFEQNIILREHPPLPSAFGLNPTNTRLQVITEFLAPPAAQVIEAKMSDNTTVDQVVAFGQMCIGQGKAFAMGSDSTAPANNVPVNKRWLLINNRHVLLEDVPFPMVAPSLIELPAPSTGSNTNQGASADGLLHRVLAQIQLPPAPKLAKLSNGPMKLATLPTSEKGFVLDYNILNSSQTNYTFQGNTTYYISGTVSLYGTNTFEGGAVLKYATNVQLTLLGPGQVHWPAGPYRPVIFTAMDDNSVGEAIGGSTGNPTNYYANSALFISGLSNPTMAYFRIAYAQQAITLNGSGTPTLSHGQIVNCQNGIWALNGGASLRNILFANVLTNFNGLELGGISVQNSTITGSTYLASFGGPYGSVTLNNCILANITNLSTPSSNAFSGSYNGFYNSTEVGSSPVTNSFYPFQSVGAGSFYLTNGTTFTNAGTTNIDATLLAALRLKTTYPPIIYSNVTVSSNTTLLPQAQRDTNSSPTLGYHYDPIDYFVDAYAVTNATLTITNGTVIACDNDSGIWLQDGSTITSIGTPLLPNWFTRYYAVQEQSVAIGPVGPAQALDINPYHYGSTGPNATFQFSKFTCPAGGGDHFYHYIPPWFFNNLLIQDCELWGGINMLAGPTNAATATIKNSLFYRSTISAIRITAPVAVNFSLSNNLIYGTSVSLRQPTNSVWYAFNNAFDSCSLSLSLVTNGNNAYIQCNRQLVPTNANNVVLTNSLGYQSGLLGNFYQPANSPLIDKGSTTANLVGLYHYTTQTNHMEETNSVVDIGYHYVALDDNGNPVDTGPVASSQSVSTIENTPTNITLAGTDPDGESVTFQVVSLPSSGTLTGTAPNLIYQPGTNYSGFDSFTFVVNDGHKNSAPATVFITVNLVLPAPVVFAGDNRVLVQTNSATLTGRAVDSTVSPGSFLTTSWSVVTQPAGASVSFTNSSDPRTAVFFSAYGAYQLRLTANDGITNASSDVYFWVIPIPPNPAAVAPPLDRTEPTCLTKATEFLYSGTNLVQYGVASQTIVFERAAVLRARVLDGQGNALSGVGVSVLDHPEYGATATRSDGKFDLAVNGGAPLTLNFRKPGLISVERRSDVPWQQFVTLSDVVMIVHDSNANSITQNSSSTQIAAGSPTSDAAGDRQAVLIFLPDTTAQMQFGGSVNVALSSMTVRATEYTIGTNGPYAMPAQLPPNSAYTYCVELSVDEADAAEADTVLFNQPVPLYADNFIGFPVGTAIPVGFFDRQHGYWVPSNNGLVIKVHAIAGSKAVLEVDGSGNAASQDQLDALGISAGELAALAGRYQAGQSLWRAQLRHFTAFDYNWTAQNVLGPKVGVATSADKNHSHPTGDGKSVGLRV